jgi:mono/diheme cytochrome c family protein
MFFWTASFFALNDCSGEKTPIPEVPSPFMAELEARERVLAKRGVNYENFNELQHFYPEGIYQDAKGTWVYSSRHRWQLGFAQTAKGWERIGERQGPVKTRRCVKAVETVCLGYFDGIARIPIGKLRIPTLPKVGSEDMAYDREGGVIFVLNSLQNEIYSLQTENAMPRVMKAPPGAYRILVAGPYLVAASWTNPRLAIVSPSGGIVVQLDLQAPVRDFLYDAKRALLWTIGPENQPITRRNGIIENLRTAIYAYSVPSLKLKKTILWEKKELVDGNSLALSDKELFAAAGGSAHLWRYGIESGKSDLIQTGAVPRGIRYQDGKVFIAGFLADELEIFDTATGKLTSLALAEPKPSATPARTGEFLFYQTGMWSPTDDNAYTCNSCHWDGLSDHRMHPGFHESRYELTRPVAGIAAVSTIFTPMQSASLAEAVEGLFRGLDMRYWKTENRGQRSEDGTPYYLQPIWIKVSPEKTIKLGPREARLSLIETLMQWPAMAPAERLPGQEFSASAQAGYEIFREDCARCHEPVIEMRGRRRGTMEALRTRPLVFGAPFYVKSGVEPYYTPNGNRISPLMNLARGGPFFSNGSAPDLDAVILRTNPKAEFVHAPENAKKPYYETLRHARLAAFLRSI